MSNMCMRMTVLVLVLISVAEGGFAEEDPPYDPIVFELLKSSGVNFQIEPSRTDRRHQPETMISGIALLDYDNDGLLDIYVLSGATMPGLKKTSESHYNRLFRNKGDLTFEDVTKKAGVEGRGYTHGVIAADYDNDGDMDLFISALKENILYRNEGDGTFYGRYE